MKLIEEQELAMMKAEGLQLRKIIELIHEEVSLGNDLAASDSDIQYERGCAIRASANRILEKAGIVTVNHGAS